eukprot:COSAG02_NODE_4614_length_5165_cov_1.697592_3_plen_51_part_00
MYYYNAIMCDRDMCGHGLDVHNVSFNSRYSSYKDAWHVQTGIIHGTGTGY